MGESEGSESKASATPVAAVVEKPAGKPTATKDKKRDKKLAVAQVTEPHVTGRILQVEIGSAGVEFAIKGKKGKAETFSLKGMDAAVVPAATALLSASLNSKNKLRVEYKTSGESRTITKLRAQG